MGKYASKLLIACVAVCWTFQLGDIGAAAEQRSIKKAKDVGHTEDTAITLKIEKNAMVNIDLAFGRSLYIRFDINVPQRVTFEITGNTSQHALLPILHTRGTTPNVTIQETPSLSSKFAQFAYVLSPASYMLELKHGRYPSDSNDPAPKGQNILRIVDITDTTDQLPFMEGSSTVVQLDPISRTATRRIEVKAHSLVRFALSGVPKLGAHVRPVGISMRDIDGEFVSSAESNRRETERPYASFILSPGTYYVEADARYNGLPSPILDKTASAAKITLQIDQIFPQNIPDSFKALIIWLRETGLEELLEFSEFIDLRDLDRSLTGSLRRLSSFAVEVGLHRSDAHDSVRHLLHEPSELTVANGSLSWPIEVREPDRAWLVVLFKVKKDRDEFRATEQRFAANHGIGLWNRILQKISSLEGIPTRRIVAVAPVECDPHLVFLDSQREAYRHGSTCLAGLASAPLSLAITVGAAASYSSTALHGGLLEVGPKFLDSFFASAKPTLTYLTTETDYFEVIVRGLRGQVIPGGSDWERLQITLALTGGNTGKPPTLRVTVDGRLASGIGDFPPDSQFTRDIEPLYSGNVTEYARRLANALRMQFDHPK